MSVISLEEEHNYLISLGTRPTGSIAHKELIERVAEKLTGMGLTIHRDTHNFTRWEIQTKDAVSLNIDGKSIPISSVFPYSGQTGPDGFKGKLIHVKGNKNKHWKKAKGAIAVFEVSHIEVPVNLLISSWDTTKIEGSIKNPLLSAMALGPKLRKAKRAGVLAVIAVWKGLSEEGAKSQYLPFTFPYQDIPAVWVAGESGNRIISAAKETRDANFTLSAVLETNCKTETIWAVVKGKRTDETIIVSTHSDGVNIAEENGHLGLLKLAEQAMKQLNERTIVFAFITGHMHIPAVTDHGQASTAWLKNHPELWRGNKNEAKAVGALVIEHLGAREFKENSSGKYEATNKAEPEIIYATTTELNILVRKTWKGVSDNTENVFKPSALIHFGEGEPLYENKIPAVALVTAPSYLLAERNEEFVDLNIAKRQIESFSKLLFTFDAMPKGDFGKVKLPSVWSKLIMSLRVLRLMMQIKRF